MDSGGLTGSFDSPMPSVCQPSPEVVVDGSRIEISPGETKYWIPHCEDFLKPKVGQRFPDLEAGINFYKAYAKHVGFQTRLSSQRRYRNGLIEYKYVVFNHASDKFVKDSVNTPNSSDGVSSCPKKRIRVSNRVCCKALIVLKHLNGGGMFISEFEEKHTHGMVSDSASPFLPVNRKLTFEHEQFLLSCARANIGPVKSYNLFKQMVGTHYEVGTTKVNFKNFDRDLRAYTLGVDAQLLLDNFFKRKQRCPEFYFDYDTDGLHQLTRVFWADPIARKSYSIFGDVVSFDATYRTNRYNLVFIPFTGVDNHKKCVTFCAGLLSKEDVPSYVWLLENFKKSMVVEPVCIVTDQDPAMKVAIAQVFSTARHRFCTWHIMAKVKDKVGPELGQNEVFMKELNRIVWDDSLDANAFESGWGNIMEFNLENNTWFSHMWGLRAFWISAYFSDLFMGGFVRTTSRSESQNSVFGGFTHARSTLVQFLLHFDNAIEAQRHSQAKLNYDDECYNPNFLTDLALERHVASVFTLAIFNDCQKHIRAACYDCKVLSICESGGLKRYGISDRSGSEHKVEYTLGDISSATCSCNLFQRVGILCCHIFLVLKYSDLVVIPPTFVVNRWTKASSIGVVFSLNGVVVDGSVRAEEAKVLANKVVSNFFSCLGLVEGDVEMLSELGRVIDEQKAVFLRGGAASKGKQAMIQEFCGATINSTVTVLPPAQAKNKGSGKRLKSARERAAKKLSKPKRMCKSCGQMAHHDSRNCKVGSD